MIAQGLRKRNHFEATESQQADSDATNTAQPKIRALIINREADDSDEERELTNLNWLLRNQSLTWPKTIDETVPDDENVHQTDFNVTEAANEGSRQKQHQGENPRQQPTKSKHSIRALVAFPTQNKHPIASQQSSPSKRPTPAERYEIFINKIKRDLAEYEKSATNYETDVTEKPPFNYSHIIGMAMLENGRVTLQQICAWIESKFAFFRVRKKWNNSIRHNLSLHHCFRKIDRKREEKGKGGYWELGVDPKKCDRKRIRNRKTAQPKQTSVQSVLTDSSPLDQQARELEAMPILNVGGVSENEEELVAVAQAAETVYSIFDEHDQQVALMTPLPTYAQLAEKATINQTLQSEQQQQLPDRIDVNLSSVPISQLDNGGGVAASFCSEAFPTTIESAGLQQQYELGTIIISTTGIIDDSTTAAGLNYLISDKFGCPSMIYAEDEVPPASENIVISSHMSTVLASVTDDMDANMDVDGALIAPAVSSSELLSGSETFPISAGSLTINCDYANFRPYMDGIDEPFQYLHSTEINRNEDILDNLLDVCVRDY
ncbi:uncharacterized protein LOC115627918 [Scaptodrosophila lebanonensis]|uniref:Uncharacterized protein LOC115627918 n=1 Tax=Drosophila lebanonensis TaxID=7225 RepID=A0A6J2TWX9_DROLE|nr:uncharacterized protein LOC115627918 [Scaptodrosophila lebanonensis]